MVDGLPMNLFVLLLRGRATTNPELKCVDYTGGQIMNSKLFAAGTTRAPEMQADRPQVFGGPDLTFAKRWCDRCCYMTIWCNFPANAALVAHMHSA